MNAAGGLGIAVALAFMPRAASAWNFNEHQQIGRAAYDLACARIDPDLGSIADRYWKFHSKSNATAKDALGFVTGRFALMCSPDSQAASATPPVRILSGLYGHACAIAADHLATASEFLRDDASGSINSEWNLLELATHNWAHFHPAVMRAWRNFLVDAIAVAKKPP